MQEFDSDALTAEMEEYDFSPEDMEVPDYDSTIKEFKDGDIITGTVVKIDKDEVLVDVGYKSEGVVPIKEVSIRRDMPVNELLNLGDEVETLVLTKEDSEGRLLLSLKRATFEKAWKDIEHRFQEEETIIGRVLEVVKGGLILDIGLRGFLPASLADIKRVKDLNSFVGEEFECRIIEVNRSRNNVVLSRKAVLQEGKEAQREKILASLVIGETVSGTVSNIVNFGAFVDLDGIDGLIHISELAWEHVNHPGDVLSIGEEISVKVLDVDKEKERISLGLKQTMPDPWKEKVGSVPIGGIIEGEVTKVVPFGAFIKVIDEIEGLAHSSELLDRRPPEAQLQPGETVKAKVLDIDLDRHRISLSLRQASSEETWNREDAETTLSLSEEVFTADEERTEEAAVDFSESDGTTEKESLEAVVAEMKGETAEEDMEEAPAEAEAETAPETVAEETADEAVEPDQEA